MECPKCKTSLTCMDHRCMYDEGQGDVMRWHSAEYVCPNQDCKHITNSDRDEDDYAWLGDEHYPAWGTEETAYLAKYGRSSWSDLHLPLPA